MKAIKYLLPVIFAAFLFGTQSCGKYEEGPSFSLRSKKARVVNHWKVDKYYYNGDETSLGDVKTYFYFEDDNTGKTKHTYGSITSEDEFTWDFNDDKTAIIIKYKNGGEYEYTILKLYEKEMWLRYTKDDPKEEHEYHLIPE